MPSGKNATLTPKQRRFIDEYLIDLNATQAAIRAGYSEKTAPVIGSENLMKPYLREIIEQRQLEKTTQNGITADYVLNNLKDIADCQDEKTTDRIKSLELLGKHLKLFTEKVEADLKGEMTINIEGEVKEWAK